MIDDFTPPEYTKDRCPCHRCKEIVAEKEATISRLRELLKFVPLTECECRRCESTRKELESSNAKDD